MSRNAQQRNAKSGNPFRYGTVVDEPYFVDRVRELAEIKQSLLNGQHLIMYSPRRYGKTSLIRKVQRDLSAQGHPCIFIDFFRIHSREKFIESYTQEIFRNYSSWEKALKKIIGLVRGIRPVIAVNDKGLPEITVKFDRDQIPGVIEEVINLPEKLAENKRWIVILDEFQEIERLNGENFEKELRASIQHHQKVSYVFLGSRKHMITNMFTRKNRAFYNFGKLYRIDVIPSEELIIYLKSGFEKSGTRIDDVFIRKLMEIAGNIPFYVQMLSAVLWDIASGKTGVITESQLNEAIQTVLWHQNDFYQALMQDLTGYQQKVLHAIAMENTSIFTKEYADRYYLSATSSTQRALDKLIDKDILNKQDNRYLFEDPIFRIWLISNS